MKTSIKILALVSLLALGSCGKGGNKEEGTIENTTTTSPASTTADTAKLAGAKIILKPTDIDAGVFANGVSTVQITPIRMPAGGQVRLIVLKTDGSREAIVMPGAAVNVTPNSTYYIIPEYLVGGQWRHFDFKEKGGRPTEFKFTGGTDLNGAEFGYQVTVMVS